ncbi:hypothetical protein ACIA74_38735 [Streptomyces sp. NPDC051658]|uniref:hypothetical protein n=1 Tax=Streptomyces sp. NPDC051658 TaxID=3365667 RepID=UPI00378AF7C3
MTAQDWAANDPTVFDDPEVFIDREAYIAQFRPVEQPGSEVNFPPIANGLDYLLSVIGSLIDDEERVSARDLKYAVLHLQAAAEVLLKYRLQQEHWTLVFADPGKARKEELADGSLASCTPAQTVDRLRRIVGLPIGDKDAAALTKLAKTRNALQHYGLTDRARAVEARTAEVLDFLVRFLDEQLLPALSDEDRQRSTQDMRTIRGGLSRMQGFVTRRMQRLRAELEPHRNRTVVCPHCDQWALVVADGDSKCRFCTVRTDTIDYVLRGDTGSNATFRRCPGCDDHTLVSGVLTAAAPDVPVDLCFSCGKTFPARKNCLRCNRRFQPHDFETVCAVCLTDRVAKEDQ